MPVLLHVSGGLTLLFVVLAEKSYLEPSLVQPRGRSPAQGEQGEGSQRKFLSTYPSRDMGSETIKGYLIQDQ